MTTTMNAKQRHADAASVGHQLPNIFDLVANKSARGIVKLRVELPDGEPYPDCTVVLKAVYSWSYPAREPECTHVNGFIQFSNTRRPKHSNFFIRAVEPHCIRRGHDKRNISLVTRQRVWEELKNLEANVLEYSAQYGIDTGMCLICGASLSDPESIARGIGPVCAEKFGIQVHRRDRTAEPEQYNLDDLLGGL